MKLEFTFNIHTYYLMMLLFDIYYTILSQFLLIYFNNYKSHYKSLVIIIN